VAKFAGKGSQKWLQIAVNEKQELLMGALRRSGAIPQGVSVTWKSPLVEDSFQEYRDSVALEKAGIRQLKVPLKSFWPPRGPVWDAIGVNSMGHAMFVEAKAHIPEAASPETKASPVSRKLIEQSLTRRGATMRPKPALTGESISISTRIAWLISTS
jgi:hypothetical protein